MTSPDLDPLTRADFRMPESHVSAAESLAGALGLDRSAVLRLAVERGLMVLARDGIQPMEAYGAGTAGRAIGVRAE